MTSLLSRLNGTKTSVPIEPRDIFMSLPQKDKRYEYPRDVQSDVWKHWFQSRNKKLCHKNEYWKWKNRSWIDDLAKLPE